MKKRLIFIFASLGLAITSIAQNPISPPGIYIPDPSARVFPDGRLYIYGSVDTTTRFYCTQDYHVLSTNDMKKWRLDKNSFSTKRIIDQARFGSVLLYAPDCIYKDGKYYLYYCISGGGEDEGVAVGNSPIGPFVDGRPIKGITQIDPTVFIDDDKQAYMFWGQFSAQGAKLKPNMTEVDLATVRTGLVTEKEHGFHEGSWMFKRNGIYYFVYAQISDRGLATSIGYSTSKSPLGPFKYGGTIIDNFGCDPNSWNNHGSVQQYQGKWYVFYHRSTHGSRMMRKACVEPITFRPDGSIPQVEMTSQGAGDPLDAFSTIDAERACLLSGKVRIVQSGVSNEELARIENENTATYKYLNFAKVPTKFKIRVCAQSGGEIQVFTNNLCMPIVANVNVEPGDGQTYKEYSVDVRDLPAGVQPLYFRFLGAEDKDLFRIDEFRFE